MTSARRAIINPVAAAPPAGKNIATQLDASSNFRGSAYNS